MTKLKTYLYKACPRCRGDLLLDREPSPVTLGLGAQVEYACIQCGRRASLELAYALRGPAQAQAA
jgi:DNA-directed RNA polymerase subunit RPC12/RpoP